MIFSELYSAYYNAVAKIIEEAQKGSLTEKELADIVRKHAFSESALAVIPALKNQKWQLLNKDLTTPIKHTPSMPLTLLQKRWLKALLSDKRVSLFNIKAEGLDDVTPLFTEEDICVYDRSVNGDKLDPFFYTSVFKSLLSAIEQKKVLELCLPTPVGVMVAVVTPHRIEYSERDDKFRLVCTGAHGKCTVNISDISKVKTLERPEYEDASSTPTVFRTATLELTDERNALERVMLHFAHLEKQAEHIADNRYRLSLKYDVEDEDELVTRILSFGPMVKVVSPQSVVARIRERLILQSRFDL